MEPNIETDPYFNGLGPLRKGCIECAGCMVGCRENAKNTLDRNYLWFAEKMGLEILPETKAEKISYHDNLYHIETKRVTSFFSRRKKIFTGKRDCCCMQAHLEHWNFFSNRSINMQRSPLCPISLAMN